MDINRIYCEDCFITMDRMIEEGITIDNVITSPFYNTGRGSKYHATEKSREKHEGRYDVHLDDMTDEEYIDFTLRLFDKFDKILKKDGCILYNINYGTENTHLMWLVIADIIRNTNFIVADDIIWKKKSALPNNVSSNKLTRIVEHVFVFCRKDEFKTFEANKKVTSVRKTGQKMYENIFNFIEAKNNDGSCKLNKATYSTDLIMELLKIYVKPGALVYDPFMGTGTTANACVIYGCDYLGSEISQDQCNYADDRIANTRLEIGKEIPTEVVEEKGEKIKLWSDGGCRGNQNETNIGAWAYHLEYVVDGEIKHKKDVSEGEKNTTNNIMELKGCLEGLKAIKNKSMKVEVYLDSAYVLNGITSWIDGWKKKNWVNSKKEPVKNKDLWVELDNEKSMFEDINFIKVKGHSGEDGNELVDKLLNETMDRM